MGQQRRLSVELGLFYFFTKKNVHKNKSKKKKKGGEKRLILIASSLIKSHSRCTRWHLSRIISDYLAAELNRSLNEILKMLLKKEKQVVFENVCKVKGGAVFRILCSPKMSKKYAQTSLHVGLSRFPRPLPRPLPFRLHFAALQQGCKYFRSCLSGRSEILSLFSWPRLRQLKAAIKPELSNTKFATQPYRFVMCCLDI